MNTVPGGEEQNQYESAITENISSKKSGGQMGQPSSTEQPGKTDDAAKQRAERGEQTAENMRYGQTVSGGGMGGMTKGQGGEAGKEGYGRMQEGTGSGEGVGESAEGERKAAGYGGGRDMNREIGA